MRRRPTGLRQKQKILVQLKKIYLDIEAFCSFNVPMLWIDYFTIMSLLLVALTSPGPSVIAIVGLSMSKGRKQGLLFAAGVALGTLTLAALAVLGFNQLIAQYAWLFWSFKILGSGYLVYLGFRALGSAGSSQDLLFDNTAHDHRSGWRVLLAGLAVHLTTVSYTHLTLPTIA